MYQYSAQIVRVVDGDTITLDIDLGFHLHNTVDVRLARIDTPETVYYKLEGIVDEAKNFVEALVPVGSTCIVDITRPDKYGRYLAEIRFLPGVIDKRLILDGGRILNDELVRAGLAKRYMGGKKSGS